ncbi:class IV lanthionine synthetase LanL [Amycolatopsis sp. NPDC058986]|uniref:class IV lanthionine synthetase LanL n=1 Tax=unclassified Amycolatopsis TaxID=2618356 RepID=UPI00366DD4A1
MPVEDADLLADCAAAVLARHDPDSWRHKVDDFWHFVLPREYRHREQGWKLHLSATPLSACLVLSRSIAVLAEHRCAFKFTKSLRELHRLVEPNADRTAAGKFITVYPDDDEHAAAIAAELHEVTLGLPGQWILTDRRYRENSLVFYRYGAFDPGFVLSDGGEYVAALTDADGNPVDDQRGVGKAVPEWTLDPFHPAIEPVRTPGSVLVGDRYRVRTAIRQSNRGGVYIAEDTETGEDIVLKRFRRHTGAATDGSDSRIRARAEARMLMALGSSDAAPRYHGLFTWDGDLFVAQEKLDGVPLRRFAARALRPTEGDSLGPATELVLDLARQLVDLLERVHEAGYVLGDFTPNNILVTPGNRLKLIDLESALRAWEVGPLLTTPGYTAPEILGRTRLINPAPGVPVDLYALGATMLYLASGVHPPACPGTRIVEMVELMATRQPAVAALRTVLCGLLADDPGTRPSLSVVRAALREPRPARYIPPAQPDPDRLIADMLAELEATTTPDRPALWANSTAGSRHDPCSVHVGAAGVLAVLSQAMRAGYDTAELVETTADWLVDRLPREPKIVPGLLFGRAGTAVSLVEAGRLLGAPDVEAAGLDLAARLPIRWPIPDVHQGTAGAGLALLALWRMTGRADLLDRARACADHLLAIADIDGDVISWSASSGSSLAGTKHWGFAHGVAGIGTFLLDAASATGDERGLDAAARCVRTLAGIADRDGRAAFWPSGEADEGADRIRLTGFCSGSNGAGTFLLRYFAATGDTEAAELAEAAAYAVRCANAVSTPVWCHGLASDGDFLLDCADVFGEARYLDWSTDTATSLASRAVRRGERWLTPDESGDVVAAFGNGFAGPLSFLLRLRHGGDRLLIGPPRSAVRDAVPAIIG